MFHCCRLYYTRADSSPQWLYYTRADSSPPCATVVGCITPGPIPVRHVPLLQAVLHQGRFQSAMFHCCRLYYTRADSSLPCSTVAGCITPGPIPVRHVPLLSAVLHQGRFQSAMCHCCRLYYTRADSSPQWLYYTCLLYTSPSPRDCIVSRMPSSA